MSGHGWPVCGHDQAVSLLSAEIRSGRVRHAYLFTGPRSIGKTALARAFSSALVCETSRETARACGECGECHRAAREMHPDILTFSLQSQREQGRERGSTDRLTIDTVREIAAASAFRAYSAGYRIIILQDAGSLTDTAQEALLKTLEEPPGQLVLMLLAERAEALLPTIRSRCELVNLNPVPDLAIANCLEQSGMNHEDAERLSKLANGLPGWAFRAVDNPDLLSERVDAIERARVWANAVPFQRIVRAFELATAFSSSRESVYSELDAAGRYWRQVMMNAAGVRDGVDQFEPSAETSLADSYRALVSVTECLNDLERNVRPRLALEAMVMQWPMISREPE